LRVFRGLDIAFSRAYGTTAPKSLPAQLRDAGLVLLAVGLAVGATTLGSALLSRGPLGLAGLGGPVGLAVVLPVVFFPLYYVFPAEDVTVREAVPGAVFAGLGWTLLGTVFGVYASQAGSFQLYGVLGGVLLLLVWFYFAGLVLLLGVTLNALLAGRLRDRQLQQEGHPGNNHRETMAETPDDDRSLDGHTEADSRSSDASREPEPDGGAPDASGDTEPDSGSPDAGGTRPGPRVDGPGRRESAVEPRRHSAVPR